MNSADHLNSILPTAEQSPAIANRLAQVSRLREQIARCETQRRPDHQATSSSGTPILDRLLPAGGFRPGTLIEWLEPGPGGGTSALVILAARHACSLGRQLVVLDRSRRFYPLALVPWKIPSEQVLVVRASTVADELWAADQALRSTAVGAVWLTCDELASPDFRRLQLAAEQGGSLGLLLRPDRHLGQPSWADVQWRVTPAGAARASPGTSSRWLSIELTRCRGGHPKPPLTIEMDDHSGNVREVPGHATTPTVPGTSQLAHPTTTRRTARA